MCCELFGIWLNLHFLFRLWIDSINRYENWLKSLGEDIYYGFDDSEYFPSPKSTNKKKIFKQKQVVNKHILTHRQINILMADVNVCLSRTFKYFIFFFFKSFLFILIIEIPFVVKILSFLFRFQLIDMKCAPFFLLLMKHFGCKN